MTWTDAARGGERDPVRNRGAAAVATHRGIWLSLFCLGALLTWTGHVRADDSDRYRISTMPPVA